MLNDRIINGAQKLIKKKLALVGGFQDPLLSYLSFDRCTSEGIQVHNTGKIHTMVGCYAFCSRKRGLRFFQRCWCECEMASCYFMIGKVMYLAGFKFLTVRTIFWVYFNWFIYFNI